MAKQYRCPFSGDYCTKDECAIYYEENDTCAIYQIAVSAENIEENYAAELLRRLKQKEISN